MIKEYFVLQLNLPLENLFLYKNHILKCKKKNSKQEDLRNRVYFFADLKPPWSKSAIAKHFMKKNTPRSTIFSILQRKARKIGPKRIVGSRILILL